MARSRTSKPKSTPLPRLVPEPTAKARDRAVSKAKARAASIVPRRLIPRVTVLTAIGAPVLMVALVVLATNPDYGPLGGIPAVLVFILALVVVMIVGQSGWLLALAVPSGIVLLLLGGMAFKTEVMAHRGVPTDVVVTGVHGSKGKNGKIGWTCDLRRADGRPLPHAKLADSGCWGSGQLGRTESVLVDPAGWVPPESADGSGSVSWTELAAVGGAAGLFVLSIALSGRRALRLAV
ncbi:hypothetical protein GCM10009760_12230 [Kitasatospora kazusensis]|uniref:MYXO-CTERM domain-containing protein n=1 Tax=Kitasatospora kazusensis TaxID=407974 RepID=A0ABP5KQW9_9ACTN